MEVQEAYDFLKEDINEIKTEVREVKVQINNRVGSLERWRAWITGAIMMLGIVISIPAIPGIVSFLAEK